MDVENQEQESPATEQQGEATRDDLIAAAREAVAASGEEQQAEPEKAQEPAAPAAEDPDAKLAAIMAKREASHAKRIEADEYFARQKSEAERIREQILEEARAEAKRLAAAELEAERAKFRANPIAAAQALAGGNVDDFVQQILKHGTPEAAAQAKLSEEIASLREAAKEGKSAREELESFKKSQQQEKYEAALERTRSEFLSTVASPEKAPYLHARVDRPEEVFDRCDALCREWQKDGLKLGIDFDRETLVAYLEKQSRERFARLSGQSPAQQSGAGSPARETGIAPKSAANGMRTITSASGSERRASPKPFHEMSPDEQREDLIRVAREAFRTHGKT